MSDEIMREHRERAALLLGCAPLGTEVRIQYTKGTAQVVLRCGERESVTSIPGSRDLEQGVCLALELMAARVE